MNWKIIQTKKKFKRINSLKIKLQEAKDTIQAIHNGLVDALVVQGPNGDQVYTLKGTDYIYRVIVEQMEEGTLTLGKSSNTILYCNRQFSEIVNYPLERIMGKNIKNFINQDDYPVFKQHLINCYKGLNSQLELNLQKAKKQFVPVRLSLNNLEKFGVPGIFIVVKNLTDFKERLKISKISHEFKMLAENAPDLILRLDRHLRINYGNNAVEQAIGINRKNFLGKTYEELNLPKDLGIAWNKLLNEVKVSKNMKGGEFNFNGPNGERVYNLNVVPEMSRKGKVLSYLAVARDITEQKDIDKLRDEFASIASHELRTPLANIKWKLESLADGDYGNLNSSLSREVGKLGNENQKLINLVNRLLDVSNIQKDITKGGNQNINLKDIVSEVSSHFTKQIKEKQIKTSIRISRKINLKTNLEIIKSVISNLIENAVKYNKLNGQLIISARESNNNIILEVVDTGIGISEKDKNKVFKKYYRSREASSLISGVGLGLYSSRLHVLRLGGKIEFTSKAGEGSKFKVILPKT